MRRLGQTPLTGEKKGSKRHVLVDGRGTPLSLAVTGANAHDVTQLETVLDGIAVERPAATCASPQHLCADKGYSGKPALEIIMSRGYTPHIKQRGEEALEKKTVPGHKARRWVVEACHSWFNRFRKLLVRFEKKASSHLALAHLAAAIICLRKVGDGDIIYG